MDSGFFRSHGFDNEFDSNAFENTELNNMDPIREAELFEEFEQDYRSGGYDPGPEPGRTAYHSAYRPTDSGYHDPGPRPDAIDSGYREPVEYDGRPRHGRSRDRHQPTEGGARLPKFARKPARPSRPKPAQRPKSGQAGSPFGELTGYVVPIMVAVVIVMVLVVLLLNR